MISIQGGLRVQNKQHLEVWESFRQPLMFEEGLKGRARRRHLENVKGRGCRGRVEGSDGGVCLAQAKHSCWPAELKVAG